MINKPACPSCARTLPGGRFNACPACGYDLRLSASAASAGSASTAGRQHHAASNPQPQSSGAQTGSTTPATTISPMASSILLARAKKCRLLLLAFAICWVVSNFTPVLWEFWSYSQLRDLVAQHGLSGNIPQNRLDAATRPGWLNLAAIMGGFVCLALLLSIIYQSTKVLRDIGVLGLKWSPGWTLGSVFIPILNLYRPWVGLNELERTLTGIVEPSPSGRSAPPTARRDFGLPTLICSLLCFFLLILDKVLDAVERELVKKNVRDQLSFYQYLDSWEKYFIADLSLVVVSMFALSIYWHKILNKMEKASTILK